MEKPEITHDEIDVLLADIRLMSRTLVGQHNTIKQYVEQQRKKDERRTEECRTRKAGDDGIS